MQDLPGHVRSDAGTCVGFLAHLGCFIARMCQGTNTGIMRPEEGVVGGAPSATQRTAMQAEMLH